MMRTVTWGLLLALGVVNGLAQVNPEDSVSVVRIAERADLPFKITGHSEWKPMTIDLHSTSQAGLIQIGGRKAVFEGVTAGMMATVTVFSLKIPMTAFVSPRGHVWVGPEKHFYVETAKGVIGGVYRDGRVFWYDSLVARKKDLKISIEKCIELFEREIDGNTLIIFNGACPLNAEGHPTECAGIRGIDLSPPLDFDIVREVPPGPAPKPSDIRLVGVQVTENIVRMGLKAMRGQYTAAVWIDIASKKVLKAEENGRQVYPK